MADFARVIKKYFKPSIGTIWRDVTTKKDPSHFPYVGSQIYSGMQGEGKTYSMVYHGLFQVKPKYPKAILVTNLKLTNFTAVKVKTPKDWEEIKQDFNPETHYVTFETFDELKVVLRHIRPEIATDGVIYMIDEIHNYFHSHDSKSMPMWIVQVFSQQRKQRILVLGTVQEWNDVILQIRNQIKNLVLCEKRLYLIKQTVINPRSAENNYGQTEYEVKKKGYFFLDDRVSSSFDTFQVINSGREIMGGDDLQIGIKVEAPAVGKRKSGAKPFWGRR